MRLSPTPLLHAARPKSEVESALGEIDRQMAAEYAKRGIVKPSWVPQGPWDGLAESMGLVKRERS